MLPDAGRIPGEPVRLLVPAFDRRAEDCLDKECGRLKCPCTRRGDDCSVVFVAAGVFKAEGGVGKCDCSVEVGD